MFKISITTQFICACFLILAAHTALADVQVDAIVPGICGNGVKEIGEQCDINDLGGNSCSTLGYATGTLSCSSACSFDISSCSNPVPEPDVITSSGPDISTFFPPDTDNNDITRVVVEGRGYPNTQVKLQLNGEIIQSGHSNDNGDFSITTLDLSPGFMNFTAVMNNGSGQSALSKPITILVRSGEVSRISGVIIPPIVNEDVQNQDNGLLISGYSLPNTSVNVYIRGNETTQFTASSNINGYWEKLVSLPESMNSDIRLQASLRYQGEVYWSWVVTPIFSNTSKSGSQTRYILPDINRDTRVNLIDYYMLKAWYNQPELSPPSRIDFNDDGIISISDFSIMANSWTG